MLRSMRVYPVSLLPDDLGLGGGRASAETPSEVDGGHVEAELRVSGDAADTAEVTRPGLWSLRVAIPDNPLGYTLVYLFETTRGPVLVDTGWNHRDSWDALLDGIGCTGHRVEDVYGVLSTHHHNDHHGRRAFDDAAE